MIYMVIIDMTISHMYLVWLSDHWNGTLLIYCFMASLIKVLIRVPVVLFTVTFNGLVVQISH